VLTKNALLLEESSEDLNARVNYLHKMKFNRKQIKGVLTGNPYWLSYSMKEIDSRLGYLQKTFALVGNDVRRIATRIPRLVTWGGTPGQISLNLFALKETCGFTHAEIRSMFLNRPDVIMKEDDEELTCLFDVLHGEIGYSRQMLVRQPQVLAEADALEVKTRHLFLKAIGRAIYDPAKPLYISPTALATGGDLDFATAVAGTSMEAYNEFLKTI